MFYTVRAHLFILRFMNCCITEKISHAVCISFEGWKYRDRIMFLFLIVHRHNYWKCFTLHHGSRGNKTTIERDNEWIVPYYMYKGRI